MSLFAYFNHMTADDIVVVNKYCNNVCGLFYTG